MDIFRQGRLLALLLSLIITVTLPFQTIADIQQSLQQKPPLSALYYWISQQSASGALANGKFHHWDYQDYGQPAAALPSKPQNANQAFGWQQQYRDAALGLTYLRARYYQPDLKSFVTMDSYSLDNKYAYGHANPIRFTDPNGHMPELADYRDGFSWLLNIFGLIIGATTVLMLPESAPTTVIMAARTGMMSAAIGFANQFIDESVGSDILGWTSAGLGLVSIVADSIAIGNATESYFKYGRRMRPAKEELKNVKKTVEPAIKNEGITSKNITDSNNNLNNNSGSDFFENNNGGRPRALTAVNGNNQNKNEKIILENK